MPKYDPSLYEIFYEVHHGSRLATRPKLTKSIRVQLQRGSDASDLLLMRSLSSCMTHLYYDDRSRASRNSSLAVSYLIANKQE